MPQDHRLPQQRFELKYLIEEAVTSRLRDFVSSYLEVDDFGVAMPNFAYPIHSLYLDTDDLRLHQAGINGTRNRFKLRLRYYDDNPEAPVYFEIKRRADNSILKQRCGVRREAVPLLLAGHLPAAEHLVSKEPRHLITIQRFIYLMGILGATPKLHNHYLREAWVSPSDNSVRVTFDRQVHAEPCFQPSAVVNMQQPQRIFSEFVILELKFTNRFPGWFNQLVRQFNLMQFASAKYSEGVEVLGRDRFRNHGPDYCWERTPAVASSAPMPLPSWQPAWGGQTL
jgi:hypothetical protein